MTEQERENIIQLLTSGNLINVNLGLQLAKSLNFDLKPIKDFVTNGGRKPAIPEAFVDTFTDYQLVFVGTANVTDFIQYCKNLKTILLNNFRGTVSDKVQMLSKLERVSFYEIPYYTKIPDLKQKLLPFINTSIKYLLFRGVKIGYLPDFIFDFPKLEDIELDNCKMKRVLQKLPSDHQLKSSKLRIIEVNSKQEETDHFIKQIATKQSYQMQPQIGVEYLSHRYKII